MTHCGFFVLDKGCLPITANSKKGKWDLVLTQFSSSSQSWFKLFFCRALYVRDAVLLVSIPAINGRKPNIRYLIFPQIRVYSIWILPILPPHPRKQKLKKKRRETLVPPQARSIHPNRSRVVINAQLVIDLSLDITVVKYCYYASQR